MPDKLPRGGIRREQWAYCHSEAVTKNLVPRETQHCQATTSIILTLYSSNERSVPHLKTHRLAKPFAALRMTESLDSFETKKMDTARLLANHSRSTVRGNSTTKHWAFSGKCRNLFSRAQIPHFAHSIVPHRDDSLVIECHRHHLDTGPMAAERVHNLSRE